MLRSSIVTGSFWVGIFLFLAAPGNVWADCGDSGVMLQILGSGGPFGVGNASSGYVLWIDGVGRIMVDAGGGTFARFHESGARVSDLRLLALSHFHPDHSSEVPSLLWAQRSRLRIVGPSGNEDFPSVGEFLDRMFGTRGAFRVMNRSLDYEVATVDVAAEEPVEVFSDGFVRVRGIGVPHGDVPTVGYRVDVGEASVAFTSDQTGTNSAFTELVRNVDVMVAHFAASEEPVGATARLHAKPSVWGQMASDANVGILVLSHLSNPEPSHVLYTSHSGADFDGSVRHLRSRFSGQLIVAKDLQCIAVD
jgi:ribonuclease BN (tRNA processing enzyme)